MTTPPYDSAPTDLVKEIIVQAEKRLEVQLTVGIAADQRAMTFAGLLFAGVAVIIGLAFARDASASVKPELISMASGFVLSASLACYSARPIA